MLAPTNSFRGFKTFGVFLLFGTVIASLAGTTLIRRGTILDRAWALNPRAYLQLAPYGKAAGVAFLLLAVTLAVAGAGWFQRRFWGWALAVGIIAIQVAGNLVNVIMGDIWSGGVGLILASVLLYFLLRPTVRSAFAKRHFVSTH